MAMVVTMPRPLEPVGWLLASGENALPWREEEEAETIEWDLCPRSLAADDTVSPHPFPSRCGLWSLI
jgi:hypothetical protein